MAVAQMEFFSECMRRNVSFRMVLPNEGDMAADKQPEPMKLLILLHGYCEAPGDWMWYGNAADIARKYHICVVLPTGENSFYLDGGATGRQYATYVGEELPRYVRKTFGLSKRREDCFIAGSSMGGFGALHTALQFADTFEGAIVLSAANIVHEVAKMKPGTDNGVANYDYYRLMFGEPENLEESIANPEKLILDRQAAGKRMPRLYLACGEQDFLLQPNRRFCDFLREQSVEFCYQEGAGSHNFEYWRPKLDEGVNWMLGA